MMTSHDKKIGNDNLFCPWCQTDQQFDIFSRSFNDIKDGKPIEYNVITKKCTVCGAEQENNEKFDKLRWSVGNCSHCSKLLFWSGSSIRTDNGELLCETCTKSGEIKDILLREIKHKLYENGSLEFDLNLTGVSEIYTYNGHTIWLNTKGIPSSMWIENGHTSFHLREEERTLDFLEIFGIMEDIVANNLFRCTGCNQDFPKTEVAGRPLFAGITCCNCCQKTTKEV